MMKIIKKPTDPIAVRISAGGLPRVGNYMVYRGKKEEVESILKEALAEIMMMEKEPEIDYSTDGF